MVRLSYKLTLEAWCTLPGASEETSPCSNYLNSVLQCTEIYLCLFMWI